MSIDPCTSLLAVFLPGWSETPVVGFVGLPGWQELLIVAFVGLLLFGKRLPEVARSVGRSVVEFKKGMRDVKGDLEAGMNAEDASRSVEARRPPPLPNTPSEPTPVGKDSTE